MYKKYIKLNIYIDGFNYMYVKNTTLSYLFINSSQENTK